MLEEIAIVELINNQFGYAWSLIQWWGSVSFGLIAMSHVARKQLNFYIVIVVPALYSAYTIYSFLGIWLMIRKSVGYQLVLIELADSGNLSTGGLMTLGAHQRIGSLVGPLMLIFIAGTFISTVLYLIYSYRKELRSRKV